jgi:Fe-S cluster biogenesis protein NfuA
MTRDAQPDALPSDTSAVPAITARVQQVLDTIRPAMQLDGGDCDLVEVTPDGTVKLRLRGACGGCPTATITLNQGIERRLKQVVPGVRRVVAV